VGSPPAIELRAVACRYGRGASAVQALRGVDLAPARGSFTAVMGPCHAEQAGFTVQTVLATTPVFRDFQSADHILGLGRNTQRAIDAGHIEETHGHRWFASLAEGPFLASFSLFTVICSR
jgi:hypothetical protein